MGMVVPLNEAYLSMINGFRNDCQSLIKKFQQQKSDYYGAFVPVWKLYKFSLIYERYARNAWINDLKQDTLQIAKSIMLNDHFVGGMYLLYGLYYMQEEPKSCIRLEKCEVEKLLTLLKDERVSGRGTCQPGLMFAKLVKNNAFEFTRFSRDYSMESQNRARIIYSDELQSVQQNNTTNAVKWFGDFMKKIHFIDDLKKVEEKYFEKKKKLKEENPELNLALDMVPDDIISGIQNCLSQDTSFSPPPLDIGERRKLLKNRKRKIRHRYGDPNKIVCKEVGIPHRKKGAPKGMRKLYYKVMINEPQSEEDSYASDEDEPKLSLPDIL